MISRRTFASAAAAGTIAALMPGVARAEEGPRAQNIVLVHVLKAISEIFVRQSGA